MVMLTFIDLIPFFVSFVVFCFFFALCYYVLQIEIDEDIVGVNGPGLDSKFGKLILQSYRITVGEIGVPDYSSILAHEESRYK